MKKDQGYQVYFDGGVKPHPRGGFAHCYGWLIKNQDGIKIAEGKLMDIETTSRGSCSVEFDALILALQGLSRVPVIDNQITIHGDSRAVIEMCTGYGKPHNAHLIAKHKIATALAGQFNNVTFTWIPREINTEADKLDRVAYTESTLQDIHIRVPLMNKIDMMARRYFGNLYSTAAMAAWCVTVAGKKRLAKMTLPELHLLWGRMNSIPKFIKKHMELFNTVRDTSASAEGSAFC